MYIKKTRLVQVSKQKNSTEPVFLQDINLRKNYWSCIECNIFSFQCSKYVYVYKHTMAIGVSETETDLTSKSFPKVWIFKRIALFLSVYCDSTSPYLTQLWHYLSVPLCAVTLQTKDIISFCEFQSVLLKLVMTIKYEILKAEYELDYNTFITSKYEVDRRHIYL